MKIQFGKPPRRLAIVEKGTANGFLTAMAHDFEDAGRLDALQKCVEEEVCDFTAEGWSHEQVVERIGLRLRRTEAGLPRWIAYAACWLREDKIVVCTVGDLGLKLIRNDKLVAETRKHIIRNESKDWVQETYGEEIDLALQGGVLTRVVGGSREIAEIVCWAVKNLDKLRVELSSGESFDGTVHL